MVQIVWLVAGILVVLAVGCHMVRHIWGSHVKFQTPFQAILLTNGSVYFGQLEDYGGPHPVLKDVYYIVSQTNPETKQTNNILVHRGKELHEPDRMYLNPEHILFVEPVGTNSKVAQLISQAEAQNQNH